ncbi:hypothetical protein ANCCAN_00789 [Ancylostoma caninum]|uniref:Uncharacterized protein n=1 Tax=Ancylostoma caninum TaxID=29170 RepID=A0A368HCV0_ANCCA|nr:hypothetical protein ANCCAN_00789 [Ancylostoma caninum]
MLAALFTVYWNVFDASYVCVISLMNAYAMMDTTETRKANV